ncbi:DEAD/DEAH box helicase [Bradyrhizobium sp. CCH5-F6]|jgi:superfamily II DNA/RNA helicase|uniref:DEAD/DEAH box helicase n=1 Tax=Bradyrhizobium sp. CCH5-F6 TaxID=1768753 RepID=UPI00076A5B4C|nr:DEAD/DEAH box helicase [Bradyrhizobium sp. CCH5-F6]
MSFSNLGLSEKVLAAVAATGYTTPTPIQEQAIPHVLARKDVLGIAQTGTGKTAAFVLPMLTILEKGRARARMPRTLILEPTRELAAQVKENFDRYGVGQKLNVALLIGGVSFGDQDAKLMRGVDVLIATPGRLLDHTERGGLLLTGVELLVIDEADRMLDMGFIPDIERVCKLVPFTRQTLFFTATMPPEIRRITETFLHNPQKIEVSKPATTAVTVTQAQVPAGREAHEKRELLRRLLREAKDLKNAIIFCNRKREVAIVHKSLQKHGFSVGALHGDMDQSARTAALEQFRKGELPLLVASDVAARGLDIPEVSHVFNFDVPHHADDYVHRIGRTGRAGRTGTAISIVTPLDQKSMAAIEKLIGQSIPRAEGDYEVSAEASDAGERPREPRGRERSRGGGRSKPQRGRDRERSHEPREARHASEARPSPEAKHSPEERQPAEARHRSDEKRRAEPRHVARQQPGTSHVPSIGRPEPRRQREIDTEPGDHSHLPAFLLRPVRSPAGA